jgi:hypothetical protein
MSCWHCVSLAQCHFGKMSHRRNVRWHNDALAKFQVANVRLINCALVKQFHTSAKSVGELCGHSKRFRKLLKNILYYSPKLIRLFVVVRDLLLSAFYYLSTFWYSSCWMWVNRRLGSKGSRFLNFLDFQCLTTEFGRGKRVLRPKQKRCFYLFSCLPA